MFAVPYLESSASIAAIFVCEMLSASINSAMRLSVAALTGRSLSIFIALSGGGSNRSALRYSLYATSRCQHQDKMNYAASARADDDNCCGNRPNDVNRHHGLRG